MEKNGRKITNQELKVAALLKLKTVKRAAKTLETA